MPLTKNTVNMRMSDALGRAGGAFRGDPRAQMEPLLPASRHAIRDEIEHQQEIARRQHEQPALLRMLQKVPRTPIR